MAEKNANGKNMVERRYEETEVQRMQKRVVDILDSIDKKKDEIKTLTEEHKDTRKNLKRGYELVEGEELPFSKKHPRDEART